MRIINAGSNGDDELKVLPQICEEVWKVLEAEWRVETHAIELRDRICRLVVHRVYGEVLNAEAIRSAVLDALANERRPEE